MSLDGFFSKYNKSESREEDMPPEVSMIFPAVKRFLSGMDSVPLPQLQLKFDLTYPEVILLRDTLIKKGILSEEVEGLSYRINGLLLTEAELAYEDIVYIGAVLTDKDIEELKRFKNGTPSSVYMRKECAKLINEGVIVDDGDSLYLAYSEETVRQLTDLSLSEDDWFIEKAVYEIMSAFSGSFRMLTFLHNTEILPESIKDAVRDRMKHVKDGGKPAREIRRSFNYDRLKYRFVEASLKACDGEELEDYRNAAVRDVQYMENLGLGLTDVYTLARLASEEIASLSLEAINKIKKML